MQQLDKTEVDNAFRTTWDSFTFTQVGMNEHDTEIDVVYFPKKKKFKITISNGLIGQDGHCTWLSMYVDHQWFYTLGLAWMSLATRQKEEDTHNG